MVKRRARGGECWPLFVPEATLENAAELVSRPLATLPTSSEQVESPCQRPADGPRLAVSSRRKHAFIHPMKRVYQSKLGQRNSQLRRDDTTLPKSAPCIPAPLNCIACLSLDLRTGVPSAQLPILTHSLPCLKSSLRAGTTTSSLSPHLFSSSSPSLYSIMRIHAIHSS
jgi:hypothetical protein